MMSDRLVLGEFPRLESPSNDRVKTLAALGRRSGRRRRGDPMLLEGWSLLEEAWRSGVEVAEVFVLDEPAPRERLRDLLERFSRSSRPRVFAVASAILKKVATTSEPQAVAASAIVPQRSPEPRRDGSPALLCGLWNIADPGNLGATLRVAEAAGADALLSFGKGVDPWSPKVLRASAGSALRLPVGEHPEADFASVRQQWGARVFALAARSGRPLWEADFASGPTLLLFGNESHGLPESVLKAADGTIHIPLAGPTESLNVATSAAVALFEAARQRAARLSKLSA